MQVSAFELLLTGHVVSFNLACMHPVRHEVLIINNSVALLLRRYCQRRTNISVFQVQAQNTTTEAPMNTTLGMNSTMMTTVGVNSTTATGASVSVQSNAFSLLFPVVLAVSLLYGRF